MPYVYVLIRKIVGDPAKIWDMEKGLKKQIKKKNYTPNIKFGGSSTECFKCHGNCKILNLK